MDVNEVKADLRVKTTKMESTDGMSINQKYLDCRRSGITGTIMSWVPGHGGDVWWLKHDGSENIGAYCFTEFEPV